MNEKLTELAFILDESGSMDHLTGATIEGFNALVAEQRRKEGETLLSTVLFNTGYRRLHDRVNVKELAPLTVKDYRAGGGTALLDAIGKTVDELGKRLAETPEAERPVHVIVAIMTDGEENSSREYTLSQIKEKITHQREKYSWEFLFLGANIDVFAEAEKLGISASYCCDFEPTEEGMQDAYCSISEMIKDFVE